MEILYNHGDIPKILSGIKAGFSDPDIEKIVDFSMEGNTLLVTISKLGQSRLYFEKEVRDSGLAFVLKKQKIALTHRPVKKRVEQQIIDAVLRSGGEVSKNGGI